MGLALSIAADSAYERRRIFDQYRVKTDKRSGIVNDTNRAENPEYIVGLIGTVISFSLETVKIMEGLSELGVGDTNEEKLVTINV